MGDYDRVEGTLEELGTVRWEDLCFMWDTEEFWAG